MGTLNKIHQLKPRVSSNGAILKVKDEFKAVFENNPELNISSSNDIIEPAIRFEQWELVLF
jgi:hypothetical protein